ncbi:hypothetical protein LINPERPRIM_LOCUS37627 [Linum perenne]
MAARTKLSKTLLSTLSLRNNIKSLASVRSGLLSCSNSCAAAPYSSSSAAVISPKQQLELLGGKDYEEYRRSLYGDITHKALLVDAVGTLLVPSQPMAQIYRQIGEKYGVQWTEDEILKRYRRAYEQPWGRSRLSTMDPCYADISTSFGFAKFVSLLIFSTFAEHQIPCALVLRVLFW